MPWNPVGSPKRNSSRMIRQSGANDMLHENRTTRDPEKSSHRKAAAVSPLAIAVPIAAPAVPNAGIGPSPRIRTTLSTTFSTVIATPSRNGVRASPAARNAPLIMKKMSIPMLKTNMMRIYASASSCTSGAALIRSSSVGAST